MLPEMVMMKVEGATQASQLPFLTGKTFTVIKTTATAGGTGKWLFLQPVGDAASAAKDIVVLKVKGAAGQTPWLVGKTFTVGKAPLVAGGNAANYLVLHPVTGAVGKSAVGVLGAAKGMTAARVVEGGAAKCLTPTMTTVALQTGTATAGKTATAATAATAVTVAKSAAGAGTIWTGTGMSLGLGLGLGAAGPLVLGTIIAAAGYGIYKYRKNSAALAATVDDDLKEALA
ncbi:MAG: hypothetical protein H7840_03280 [Alphaproteobacteria bacterium]